MKNETLEQLFLGSLQVENHFYRVIVCRVTKEGVIDVKTKKIYPWPHLSRIEYHIDRGVICYPQTQVKELVSLSLFQQYVGRKVDYKNKEDLIDDLVYIYTGMIHPKGKHKIKK